MRPLRAVKAFKGLMTYDAPKNLIRLLEALGPSRVLQHLE